MCGAALPRRDRYKREEILGRNCRFLQGPGTDRRAVKEIRSAIDNGQECTVRLINYTKTGQPFWNMFSLAPVFGQDGKVRYFVGVQVDVSAKDMSPPSCVGPAQPRVGSPPLRGARQRPVPSSEGAVYPSGVRMVPGCRAATRPLSAVHRCKEISLQEAETVNSPSAVPLYSPFVSCSLKTLRLQERGREEAAARVEGRREHGRQHARSSSGEHRCAARLASKRLYCLASLLPAVAAFPS